MQKVIQHTYIPFSLMLISVVLFLCFTINIIISIIINIIIDNRRRPVPTPAINSNCTGSPLYEIYYNIIVIQQTRVHVLFCASMHAIVPIHVSLSLGHCITCLLLTPCIHIFERMAY